jgi:hypothetical protein
MLGLALAVLVLLLGFLVIARADGKSAPPPPAGHGWLPSQRFSALSGEVIFAIHRGWLDLGLDCLVAGGSQPTPVAPVSIEATGPFMCGLGSRYAEAIPHRLADGGRIFIEITSEADRGAKARVRMDRSLLVLAVHPNPDLLRHLGTSLNHTDRLRRFLDLG